VAGKEAVLSIMNHVHRTVSEFSIEATFAALEIDNGMAFRHEFGKDVATELARGVCQIIEGSLRKGDMVGYLGEGLFAVILLDCNNDDAKIVLNRLRMNIESATINSKSIDKRMKTSISVAFSQISPEEEVPVLIERCRSCLKHGKTTGGNTIYAA